METIIYFMESRHLSWFVTVLNNIFKQNNILYKTSWFGVNLYTVIKKNTSLYFCLKLDIGP